MATVAFHTLGCKVNHYETEAIWQLFKTRDMNVLNLNNKLMYMLLIHVQ